MQPASIRVAIAGLGRELAPPVMEAVVRLYDAEQRALSALAPAGERDLSYGPNERQRLDVYAPARPGRAPILVWVHGGGFVRGDKGGGERWQNAHAGRWAARAGFLGIVINYRLAPRHGWPAGAEDVAAVVDWLKTHADGLNGDPARIVLAGTSSGAAHVAGYLRLRPGHADEVRGAILLSGVYGATPTTGASDLAYYGEDIKQHADRVPLESLAATALPIFAACAEFDPARFQQEFVALLQQRLDRHRKLPRSHIASGHNHYSIAYHLGTADSRLADEIAAFVRECCEPPD